MNRIRKLLAVGALALAVPLVAGCGGDDDEDPADILRDALGQETNFDSGVLNIGIDGSLEGTQSGTVEADITGPFQSVEGEPTELQLDADAQVSAEGIPDVPGGTVSFEFAGGFGIADDSLFVTYDDTSYEASEQLYSQISPILESAESAGDTTEDPESADAFIDALSNLENEGNEDLDGESVTHVSGDLDFGSLVESSEQPVPVDPAQLEGLTGTVDVFVAEEDNSFRQLDFGFAANEVELLSAQGIDGISLTFSIGITEPNTEQTIEAPTDAQPLDDLLKQFDTSEAELRQLLSGGFLLPSGGGGIAGLDDSGGTGGDTGGTGTPGGAATDPAVQECIAGAESSEEIIECLNQ